MRTQGHRSHFSIYPLALALACATAAPTKSEPTGAPGSSAENPIKVERMSEEVDHIQSQKCPGGGHWQVGDQSSTVTPERGCVLDKIEMHCPTSPEPSVVWFLHCM